MPVAPTGNYSRIFDDVRTLLSESATFQTWVGAANATEALASIYIVSVELPGEDDKRPYAYIHTPDQSWSKISTGTNLPQNTAHITFEEDVAEANEDVESDALYAFTNVFGDIIADLHADMLFVNPRIDNTAEPQRTDSREKDSIGDLYMAEIRIDWGFNE